MGALRDPLRELDPPALVVWVPTTSTSRGARPDRQRESFPSAQVNSRGLAPLAVSRNPARVAEHVIPFLREQVRASQPLLRRPGRIDDPHSSVERSGPRSTGPDSQAIVAGGGLR